jgi:transmembrane sensor
LKVAAIFIFFIGIGGAVYYYLQNETNHIISEYGNIKKVSLPDSSIIVLNGNSDISFRKHWNKNKLREIWLEGEAFFNVKHLDTDNHITENERFLVHVKDVVVEVLGTSFDIRSRRNKTEIVLQNGKIKLSFPDKKRQDIIMTPSEIISIAENSPTNITRSTIKAEQFSSWTQKKLELTNASLEEIIQYLEDNYGKKIILDDSSLKNRKIEGTILIDNLDDALFVLSKILKVKVIKNDAIIYFRH